MQEAPLKTLADCSHENDNAQTAPALSLLEVPVLLGLALTSVRQAARQEVPGKSKSSSQSVLSSMYDITN